jgi:hypothetical protein
MRLRSIFRTGALGSALVLAASAITPAFAGDGSNHPAPEQPGVAPSGPDMRPEWRDGARPAPAYGIDPRARDEWLGECRSRASRRDDGLGGAVIGGLVGGFAGNRIAGRGHRTVGTIAGAAVGAVAGAAIDNAEDRGRARDECETYLDDYYARYSQPTGHHGYGYAPGYGYAQQAYATANGCCGATVPMMMVPVMMAPRSTPECTETVETTYEYVPVRRRVYHAPRPVPDKRIRTN